MSAKAKILVIRKVLVGEWDLLAYAYGSFGKGRVLVRRGFHPKGAYAFIFEPFNLLTIDYRQSGELLILNDIKDVEFCSYLALRDYRRFIWMSKVVQIVVNWASYYDSHIFSLLQSYLKVDVKNHKVFEIKLKLELLKSLGIYREDLFESDVAKILRELDREHQMEPLERIFLDEPGYRKISESLEEALKKSLD